MIKHVLLALSLLAFGSPCFSQELFVNTEPASNMAKYSLGVRIEGQGFFNPAYKRRESLELMYGASKNLMVHTAFYMSDYYQSQQHFEGGSAYAKYRFLSIDSVQRHFRGSLFAKLSTINNPVPNQEITLEGDNSGLQSGVIFTQLLHKLALSGSVSYLHAWDNAGGNELPAHNPKNAIAYSISTGYLLLPFHYRNYHQTNVNVYAEFLGKTNTGGYGQHYLDAAPAVQFIFNSLARVDFSYRIPLYNSMVRNTNYMYLIRIEYNFFNVF